MTKREAEAQAFTLAAAELRNFLDCWEVGDFRGDELKPSDQLKIADAVAGIAEELADRGQCRLRSLEAAKLKPKRKRQPPRLRIVREDGS